MQYDCRHSACRFEDGSFGRVIDKGTFDAVLTGGFKMARTMASEVADTLIFERYHFAIMFVTLYFVWEDT